MPSLTRASALYIAAAALNAAVPFAVLPWLTRWLGPAGFGVVGTYLALVNLAMVVVGLSVHGVISVVHFKQDPRDVPAYLRSALLLLWLTGMPLLALLALAGPWLAPWTAIPAAWLWTVALVAMAQFVVALGLAVFQAREEPLRYGAIQVGLALGWGTLSLLFIGALGLGWAGRALAQMAAALLAAGGVLALLHRQGLLTGIQPRAPLQKLLAFGLPLVPHSLAGAVLAGADRLVLTGLAGAEVAGQYFAAFQVAAVLTVGAAALNQAWVPWLYRRLADGSPQGLRQVVRTTYGLCGLLLLAGVLLAWAGPRLLPWVAGARFAAAGPLLWWLAPAAALSGMYYFVTNYLFYAERTGWLSIITVGCAVLQLALMAWWVPSWGAHGAAASVCLTAGLYLLATWAAAQRAWPMPWSMGLLARSAP